MVMYTPFRLHFSFSMFGTNIQRRNGCRFIYRDRAEEINRYNSRDSVVKKGERKCRASTSSDLLVL